VISLPELEAPFITSHDIDVALREAVAAPVASYLLGFSPQIWKLNGSFHTLRSLS